MIFIDVQEAQLYRLLSGFFGRERVIPHMSVLAVCGGELPNQVEDAAGKLRLWAQGTKCLFTIVDHQDSPKMVIEFFSGFERAIDPNEEERQRFLPTLLPAAGVRYVTLSWDELEELIDPRSSLDLLSFLEDKIF
jgi:hypothetical protein